MAYQRKFASHSNAKLLEEYGAIRESIHISVYKNGRAPKWMHDDLGRVTVEILKRMKSNPDQEA